MNRLTTGSSAGSLRYARTGTPWQCLQDFLEDNLDIIRKRELSDAGGIRLYSFGSMWLSFNRSAHRLSRLFPDAPVSLLDFKGEKTVMLALTGAEVDKLKRAEEYRIPDPSLLIFPTPVPDGGASSYDRWFRRTSEELGCRQF